MRECPAPRRPALRRRSAALGAALAVVLAVAVPLVAAGPAGAASRCGGAVPDGAIRVVVVVDDGVRSPNATCLVLGSGEQTGAGAWAARAAVLGMPAPRYADSGLLCAIDGYPSQGCGDRSGATYQYWAYFSGTSGSWVYGSGNPHARRLRDGDILGWHFITGTGSDPDQPPRLAPSSDLFPPLPPPPTAAPAPAPSPSGPSGGGGASARPGAGGAVGPVPGSSGAGGSAVGDPTAPSVDATADPAATDTTAPDTTSVATTAGGTVPAADELAATPASSESGAGGAGGTVGLVVGLLLIAALGGGAVVRARSRG